MKALVVGKVTKALTKDDLRSATWDYTLAGLLGVYRNEVVRVHNFDLDNKQVPGLARRCNLSEGWVEYTPTEDGKMTGEPLRDAQGKVVVKRMDYDGKLVVFSLKGDELATLIKEKSDAGERGTTAPGRTEAAGEEEVGSAEA